MLVSAVTLLVDNCTSHKVTRLTLSYLGWNGILLISIGVKDSVFETPKSQSNIRENATRCVAYDSRSYSTIR